MNSDRRRINPPSSGTSSPVYARTAKEPGYIQSLRPKRTRGPNDLRKICRFPIPPPDFVYTDRSSSPPNQHHSLRLRLRLPRNPLHSPYKLDPPATDPLSQSLLRSPRSETPPPHRPLLPTPPPHHNRQIRALRNAHPSWLHPRYSGTRS
jgi:hypothetical protein